MFYALVHVRSPSRLARHLGCIPMTLQDISVTMFGVMQNDNMFLGVQETRIFSYSLNPS